MTTCTDCGTALHPKAVRQGAEYCWQHVPPRAVVVHEASAPAGIHAEPSLRTT